MDLPFELHIALRYLLAKRKQAFISVISLISTLGVIVGVMALVIALALMTGLQGELRDRILGSHAHPVRDGASHASAAGGRNLQPRPVRVRLDVRLLVARRGETAARQGCRRLHSAARRRHLQGARDRAGDSGAARPAVPRERLVV